MKVGYQGVNGTFSEMAVNEYFKNNIFEAVNFKDFKSIMKAIEEYDIDYALIPVENTTTGIISRVYDLFNKYNIFACGEINIKIEEQLLGVKGSKIEDIKEVYSHPEAIAQCENFFNEYKNIKPVVFQDTAKSAEYISDLNDKSKAALASRLAGKYYNLCILKENVQDNDINITRFLCVRKNKVFDKEADKISCMFILKHQAGALYNLLKVFAENEINLLKLESRPIKGRLFEYCFYLDFDGNLADENVKNAFKNIDNICLNYKILGCYKKGDI